MSIRYLLDTNAASYAINKKSAAVDRHLAKVAVSELSISAVTEGELRYGVTLSGSLPLRAVVEQFLSAIPILPWDSQAARCYGQVRAELEHRGQLLGSLDLMIATQAIALDLTLVTADRAFKRVKQLKTEDWTR